MRSLVPYSLIFSLLAMFGPTICLGQESGLTQKHHLWGRFQPGAWKRVQVVTETFDEEKTLRSVTETKTSVKEVSEDGVTLLVKVTVEVEGKRFEAEPQTVKQGFHGELATQHATVENLGTGNVTIEGRTVPCKILQLVFATPVGKTLTKIYYSDSVQPYVIKRETIKTDGKSKTPTTQTTVNVLSLGVSCKLRKLKLRRNMSRVKAVHKHSAGTTTTWAFTSADVPGGVVRQISQDVDNDGRLIRRSSLRMTDYDLVPEEEGTGLFRRWRLGRFRKP